MTQHELKIMRELAVAYAVGAAKISGETEYEVSNSPVSEANKILESHGAKAVTVQEVEEGD